MSDLAVGMRDSRDTDVELADDPQFVAQIGGKRHAAPAKAPAWSPPQISAVSMV